MVWECLDRELSNNEWMRVFLKSMVEVHPVIYNFISFPINSQEKVSIRGSAAFAFNQRLKNGMERNLLEELQRVLRKQADMRKEEEVEERLNFLWDYE